MYRCREDLKKPLDTMIANDVQTLLSKPALQEVILIGDWEGRWDEKVGLIQGLVQQKDQSSS